MSWLLQEEPKQPEKSLGQKSVDIVTDIGRHVTRNAYNIGTRAAGTVGDVASLANKGAKGIQQAITGNEGSEYEDTILGKIFPTTETQRQNIEKSNPKFSEFIKPKNKVEMVTDNILEDFSMILTPGGLAKKGISVSKKLSRPFAISLGSNISGELTKDWTGDEKKGNFVKMGTAFLASLINPSLAIKKAKEYYDSSKRYLPSSATVKASSVNNGLDALEQSITKGRPRASLSPNEQFVLDKIGKVRDLEKNGVYNVEQLVAQKKSLNDELANLYDQFPSYSTRKQVRNQSKKVTAAVKDGIEEYGKINPQFYDAFNKADEVYGAVEGSKGIAKWVMKNLKTAGSVTGLSALFGGVAPTAITLGAGAVVHETARFMYKISKSPELTKLYANALKAASQENSLLFNKYYQELDNKLSKEMKNDKWELVD